jgi:hypothetical protein
LPWRRTSAPRDELLRMTKAVSQLRLVRVIVTRERQRGLATRELLERASAVVEQAAVKVEAEADTELLAFC